MWTLVVSRPKNRVSYSFCIFCEYQTVLCSMILSHILGDLNKMAVQDSMLWKQSAQHPQCILSQEKLASQTAKLEFMSVMRCC